MRILISKDFYQVTDYLKMLGKCFGEFFLNFLHRLGRVLEYPNLRITNDDIKYVK